MFALWLNIHIMQYATNKQDGRTCNKPLVCRQQLRYPMKTGTSYGLLKQVTDRLADLTSKILFRSPACLLIWL